MSPAPPQEPTGGGSAPSSVAGPERSTSSSVAGAEGSTLSSLAGTDGRRRAVIESVRPEVDCGRFAAKRVVGEWVVVEADIFTDGHDRLGAVLRHRAAGEIDWQEVPMEPLVNDR